MVIICKYTTFACFVFFWHQMNIIESSVNLAFDKETIQSSDYDIGKYPSSKAADGNIDCTTGFAHTNHDQFEWWRVDLGDVFEIEQIKIFYRMYFIKRLYGYSINITTSLEPLRTWLCYTDPNNGNLTNLNPSHKCRHLGRYVTFSRNYATGDMAVINLCELQVYGCPKGFYGEKDCNSNCSVGCISSRCNPDDGTCNCTSGWLGSKCNGCALGYYGKNCSPCPVGCQNKNCSNASGECLNDCKPTFYGPSCNFTCPENCYNKTCENNSGYCKSCEPGYHGNKCNLKCPSKCKDKSCKKENGDCISCVHAFIGNNCTECKDGYFSDLCTQCSIGCVNGTCRKDNGHCIDGCKATFFGKLCDKSCSANCKTDLCDRDTGICVGGCMNANFHDSKCKDYLTDSSWTEWKILGPIIGGVVALIFVVVFVVGAFFYMRRRRNSGKDSRIDSEIKFCSTTLKVRNEGFMKKRKIENTTDAIHIPNKSSNDYINSPAIYINLTLNEVPVSDFSSIISKKAAEKQFASEYENLPKGSIHPTTIGKRPENKIKNRFLTTFPYDHSRVFLKPISREETSDYINANYIDGAEIRRAYIATQGPKTNTLFDFWRMVWQEKSGKIVMLTNLIENEKPKCDQYWPDVGREKDFGSLRVTVENEKEYAFFFERTLQLTNKKTKETRKILQFHFTMWTDHGTPDPVQLMLFHRNVKDAKTDLTGPPVIHCAAGIGRTGTFIALDTLHEYGDKTGKIDVFEYVIKMRKDRMNMIQTLDQYVVLHEVLLESFQYTERSLSRSAFLKVCSEYDQPQPKNQTHVYKEFQSLSALRPVYGLESYESALDRDNRRKTRNPNILAVEKYRPYLMSQHFSRTNFINAVMIPTFRKKCGFFVTHYPLENTVVDFWCLIFDHDSSTIIVLDEISDKDNVLHWYPDDEQEMNVDSFQIKIVSGPHTYGKVTEIDFTVTHQDDEKPVRMLMIRPWAKGRYVPQDKNALLKLVEMTMERQTPNSGPVTVVSSDGARCCGLFCTVINVLLNLRIEEEIDIFHTVRQLQIRRPEFITDCEEYRSCYEIVKVFLESSNVYANV